MGMGVDTSTNVSSVAGCLKASGLTFVCRYLAVVNTWKVMTAAEAEALSRVGLWIVSVWEDGPADQPSYFTGERGRADGLRAFSLADTLRQPGGTPVYFAVDYDATPDRRQTIIDYFAGIHQGYADYAAQRSRSGLPVIPYHVGAYGSYDVLSWLRGAGLATFFWQAYAPAWSRGRNASDWPGYNLRQRGVGRWICGVQVDPDVSNGAGGGWRYL